MSFLNQLKSQAKAAQGQREQQDSQLEERAAKTEAACDAVLSYLKDLARQLNVLQPSAPPFSLDGKTPWPAMKLVDFRVDARRKSQTRASVQVAAEHGDGQLAFRLLNTAGFEIVNVRWPAERVNQSLLDELAKRIVSEPSRFA